MDVKALFTGIGKTALSTVTGGISDRILDVVQNSGVSQQTKDELAKARVEQASKLQELEAEQVNASIKATADVVVAINQTMQAEAKSEHWLQWSWRPIAGLTLSALIINNYILLPYCAGWGVKPIEVPALTWDVLLAVVGVTAFTRGAAKVVAGMKQGSDS